MGHMRRESHTKSWAQQAESVRSSAKNPPKAGQLGPEGPLQRDVLSQYASSGAIIISMYIYIYSSTVLLQNDLYINYIYILLQTTDCCEESLE